MTPLVVTRLPPKASSFIDELTNLGRSFVALLKGGNTKTILLRAIHRLAWGP